MIAFLLSGLFGAQKYHVGIIVTVKYAQDGINFIGILGIVAHSGFGFLHKPVGRFILRRNRDDVDVTAPTSETLEIPNLGFTALADKIHDRIALSGVDRFAADLFYSAHTVFPPMNGIAPYRPCR